MRCEAARDELAALLDGELAPVEVEALEAHLAACEPCRGERAALERARDRVRALPRVAAPAALLAGVGARLGGEVARPSGEGVGCGALEAGDLSAYLDVELESAERARVEAHLQECAVCRRELVGLDSAVSGVQRLPRALAPATLMGIVRERLALLGDAPTASARPRSARTAKVATRGEGALPTPGPATPPRAPREPIQLPQTFRRFLAAASIVVLALGALQIATPNRDPLPHVFAPGESGSVGAKDAAPAPAPAEALTEAAAAPRRSPLERERTLVLVADGDASVDAVLSLFRSAAQVEPTRDPGAFVVRGNVLALRTVLDQLPAGVAPEDPAAMDALVPRLLDRVYGRNGEVYTGTIERQDDALVTVRAGALALELPMRRVVRVERATDRAAAREVEIGLLVRRRSTPRGE